MAKLKCLTEKQVAARIRAIKKSNAKFKEMSRSEKRVQIAKDVLKQVAAKKFRPTEGEYLDSVYLDLDDAFVDAQKALIAVPSCDVCAIGSVFCAVAMRADKVELYYGSMDGPEMVAYLRPYFSEEQLRLMECAFEGALMDTWCFIPEEETDRAEKMYKKYRSVTARLVAVMENVIANDGTFKP